MHEPYLQIVLAVFGLILAAVFGVLINKIGKLADVIDNLRRTEKMLEFGFELAAIGKSYVSTSGKYLRINKALCDIVGYTKEELFERDFQTITHPDDLAVGADSMADALNGKMSQFYIEKRYIHKDGHTVWVKVHIALIRDATGSPLFFVAQVEDITERKQAEQKLSDYAVVLEFQKTELERANNELEALANTDSLTGIRNRRALMERLHEQLAHARRYNVPLSMILLDIDNFKPFNDKFGHLAGDDVLRRVASIISDEARECDYVARYGGEELAVVCAQTSADGAASLADRMRQVIEGAPWDKRPITASFGVVEFTEDIDSLDEVIQRADDALYASKAAGRNRVTVAEPRHQPLPERRTAGMR